MIKKDERHIFLVAAQGSVDEEKKYIEEQRQLKGMDTTNLPCISCGNKKHKKKKKTKIDKPEYEVIDVRRKRHRPTVIARYVQNDSTESDYSNEDDDDNKDKNKKE